MNEGDYPIVFYDGDCGFCNKAVVFILKHDKTKNIRFASIQSEIGQRLLKKSTCVSPDLSTFYLLEKGNLYSKSTASIRLGKYFSFPANLIKVLIIIPKPIRDKVYDWVAKRRHQIYSGYCAVLDSINRERFIE